MRIYPPVHTIARQAIGDDTLMNRRIPKGSAIMIAPWLLHRHIKLWEQPGRFDPERFSPERSAARPRFSYLPFGGGKRICIGAAFALTEATVLLPPWRSATACGWRRPSGRTAGPDYPSRPPWHENDPAEARSPSTGLIRCTAMTRYCDKFNVNTIELLHIFIFDMMQRADFKNPACLDADRCYSASRTFPLLNSTRRSVA